MNENQQQPMCPARQRLALLGRECKACGRCRRLERILEPPTPGAIRASQSHSANIERPS